MDENDIDIIWLAYTIFARDKLSEPGRTRQEGRIVAITFFFNSIHVNCLNFLISRRCLHSYHKPKILCFLAADPGHP